MAGKHMRQEPATQRVPFASTNQSTVNPDAFGKAEGLIDARGRQQAGTRRQTSNKKRENPFVRVLSYLLIFGGVALLLAAGGMWFQAQSRYWKQDQTNKALATHVKVKEAVVEEDPCPVEVDWEALKAVNKDVIGWIYVPNTVVNYPVYQGVDNDQYLRTNAMGEYSVGGQLFLDYQNTKPGMVDRQSIIYGHHLWDGTMFEPLSHLDDQAVFDATDTIWYLTEQDTFELQPLMMYYATPDDETVQKFFFASDDEFHAYLQTKLDIAVTKRADAAELVAGATRVLSMSTCNYYDGYGRSILVAIEK